MSDDDPKTSGDTPAVAPGTLVPQPHGGALLRGNPGNKGGRPPDEFKAFMARLAGGKRTLRALEKILDNPNHPHWLGAWKWATERGYGKAPDILAGPDGGPIPVEIIVTRRLVGNVDED